MPILSSEEVFFDSKLLKLARPEITNEVLKKISNQSKNIKVTKIRYKSLGHDVVGYIIEPRNIHKKLPCIIYNRGGNRAFGALNLFSIFNLLGRVASWGYIVIASQYSGWGESGGKDEIGGADINDVLILKKILDSHPLADTSRIGMYGMSRGGMMTYLALAKVKWIKAATIQCGTSNALRLLKLRPEFKKIFKETFGGSVVEMKKRSAVFWPEKINKKTPILILHGACDWRVSPQDSIDMSSLLIKHKVPHRLTIIEGADHSLSKNIQERDLAVKDWFERFLIQNEDIPITKSHGL